MIANTHYGYVGKSKAPKFTYTGNSKVRDDGVVELLTSGTLVFLEPKVIDVFMVGGGGRGAFPASVYNQPSGKGGGGGGYTRTIRKVSVSLNQSINVTIGAGSESNSAAGGSSSFASYSVNGGESGKMEGSSTPADGVPGANGGSGGGAGVTSNSDYGAGGSNGGNGESGGGTASGGAGQGFNTREFGEANGKLYAGGGGGGRYMISATPIVSSGGAGGGGTGGWVGEDGKGLYQAAGAGGANTGGGGGGGARNRRQQSIVEEFITPGSGGSGIVCFRESVELPELAGTWVMNNRIYAPEDEIRENVSFTMPGLTVSVYDVKSIMVRSTTFSGIKFFGVATTINANSFTTVYDFNTNSWKNTQNSSPAVLTFPSGATASDTFREWLASNATKQ